jgi:hypothetical protein
MKITTKVGTIAQVLGVSIKKCDGVHNKKTSNNFNKNLCFGTILSEHVSESRSINPFNLFRTIYIVTSTGEQ